MEHSKLTTLYMLATQSLARGDYISGSIELERLRKLPREELGGLWHQVDFSYAVAISELGRPDIAISILLHIEDEHRLGNKEIIISTIWIELSSAYLKLGLSNLAESYAEKAIDMTSTKGKPDPIALQNHGLARMLQGNSPQAEKDLLRMLAISCEERLLDLASLACLHLANLFMQAQQMSRARTWLDLGIAGCSVFAPKYLKPFAPVKEFIHNSCAEPDPVDKLPAEARTLIDLIVKKNLSKNEGLTVLDIDLFAFLNATNMLKTNKINIEIPLLIPEELSHLRERLFEALRSEIQCPRPLPNYPIALTDTFLFQVMQLEKNSLPLSPHSNNETIKLIESKLGGATKIFSLFWESDIPWVWGYATLLKTLANLYSVSALHIQSTNEKYHSEFRKLGIDEDFEKKIQFITQGDRLWPIRIQSRFIGLAQYHTGLTIAPPFFMENFVLDNIYDRETNVLDFQKMGYTKQEAEDLSDGGIVALLATKIIIPGSTLSLSLGGLPLNEIHPLNPPRTIECPPFANLKPGFVVDKYYQTWFNALSSSTKDHGWYGRKSDIFRDHFQKFREGLDIVDAIRAKHYAIPIIQAEDIDGLRTLAERMPEFEGQHIWFRGQTRLYRLNRPPLAALNMFGSETVEEPALLGAAPRRGLDYNVLHPTLQLLLQDYMYKQASKEKKDLSQIHEEWTQKSISSYGGWDIAVMAFAQHYGIPTHGLDITSSWEVALWFATHKFHTNGNQHVQVQDMTVQDWPTDPKNWPVIFFILPVTDSIKGSIIATDHLLEFGISALRPIRQKAAFFMGAHGMHQNRLAEALVCGVRLAPGEWSTDLSFQHLFPSAAEDEAYKYIIGLKERFGNGPFKAFFKEIPVFQQDPQS